MLKALYDYGVRNGLTLPPGFVKKQIRAYISLTASGDFLGIEQCTDELLPCPDIGSLANSPDKCNLLAEKCGIILFVPQQEGESNAKQAFFCRTLCSGADAVPEMGVCLAFFQDAAKVKAAADEAARLKIKPGDRISFKVSGTPVVRAEGLIPWWCDYRKQFAKDSGQTRCLITGEITAPPATVPPVSGLQVVGGHARGDTLICFDKSAFCSYGLKQVANAPVSEEAFAAVKAAMDDLLAGSPAMYKRDKNSAFTPTAPIFAGMRFVHWYDQPLTPQEDILLPDFCGYDSDDDEKTGENAPAPLAAQQTAAADAAADSLIQAVQTGNQPQPLSGRYHIMLVSGANGRVMVRRYEQGNYADLQEHLRQWNKDLALCDNLGTGKLPPRKLTVRLIALLTRHKNDSKVLERLKKELSGLTPAIVMAIINGTPLPDAVAGRALANIRSQMLDPDENDKFGFMPDGTCCQWLKVWLLRKARARNEEVSLMPYYDPNFPNAAYHCGALVAVYADLQRAAMPDVNAGIVQRYYASASRTPKLVLGQLERLAKYHLAKLDKRYLAQLYEARLNEPYCFFAAEGLASLPATLTLEEQSYFAIGYRQMSARLVADRKKAAADKKAAAENPETTEQEEK